jgi:hypothetical protein
MSDNGIVRHLIAGATDAIPEPPRPLMRELSPADPFPVAALGGVLGAAARAIHDRVQAPMAICAQSVIGAATLAVQGHADVELPIGPGRPRPVSCFLITVAASGERKTAADAEALWPVRRREAALREQYDTDLPSHANDKIAWDKARDEAVKRGKGDRAAIRAALDKLGPPPVAPLIPMLTCPEPTFEGLCRLFAGGWPSLGLFASEAGQFIGGHGMSEDHKLKTAAALSSLWDGEPIRRVRAGDGAVTLPGLRLAAHLMSQPAVADIWFRDPLLADQGTLSRLLVTAPDSAAGTRFHHDERPETDHALRRYGARLLDILEAPLPLAAGKPNELAPRRLPLGAAARRLQFSFADHIEGAIAPGGALEPVAGLANKLPEHAARLAAMLTLVANIDAGELAGAEMAAGIELAQHYAAEALRLFGASRVGDDLRLAQRLLGWMLTQWGEPAISLPDIYQRGPNAVREQAAAKKLVATLESHGWLTRLPQGANVAGVYRRDAWRIVKR